MSRDFPLWIRAAVSYMFRFVAGAFGVSVPHPWKFGMCGPFWTALLGCTVGLPIVLLGWIIRLVFGQGRAERFWDAFASVAERKAVCWSALILFIFGAYTTIVVALTLFILEYDWLAVLMGFVRILLYFGVYMLVGGVVVGILVLAVNLEGRLQRASCQKPSKKTKPATGRRTALAFTARTATLPARIAWTLVRTVLVGAWQLAAFLGLMIVAVYKKFCPITEFP